MLCNVLEDRLIFSRHLELNIQYFLFLKFLNPNIIRHPSLAKIWCVTLLSQKTSASREQWFRRNQDMYDARKMQLVHLSCNLLYLFYMLAKQQSFVQNIKHPSVGRAAIILPTRAFFSLLSSDVAFCR